MPFVEPSYEALHLETTRLQETYNRFARRYTPPEFEVLCSKSKILDELYRQHVRAKNNLLFGLAPDATYIEKIDCIRELEKRFPRTEPETPERHQAHSALLGALLYLRHTIEEYYSGPYNSALSYVGFTSVLSSALYQTLNEVLRLTDLNKLDDLTIATCCKAYRSHLSSIEAQVGSEFIHKKDVNFFARIDKIVVDAEQRSRLVERQIRQLDAIQGFAGLLRITDSEISSGLNTYVQVLTGELSKKDSLPRQEMLHNLEGTALSPRTKAMISYLLPDEMTLNKDTCATFVATMKERLVVNSKYVLLGAYELVLADCPLPAEGKIEEPFPHTLKKAIGVTLNNVPDDKDRELMLIAFQNYLTLPGIDSEIKFGIWRDHPLLLAQTGQQLKDLQKLLAEMQPLTQSLVM